MKKSKILGKLRNLSKFFPALNELMTKITQRQLPLIKFLSIETKNVSVYSK